MKIGAYEMESPLMNAGGVVRSIEEVKRMSQTGVGAVLGGSFTLEARYTPVQSAQITYNHDPETGITDNSYNMPNKGMGIVAFEVSEMIEVAHDHSKPFILNIAPVTDDPVNEISDMFEFLSVVGVEKLDAVEINAGCPSVRGPDGARKVALSHSPDMLKKVLNEVQDISANDVSIGTIIVRAAPFRDMVDAIDLTKVVDSTVTDAVTFNSFPSPAGIGGQSGPGMRQRAEEQTQWLIDARGMVKGARFDIIGSVGIIDAESMKARLGMGASAVSASTLFTESSSWVVSVDKLLRDYAELAA